MRTDIAPKGSGIEDSGMVDARSATSADFDKAAHARARDFWLCLLATGLTWWLLKGWWFIAPALFTILEAVSSVSATRAAQKLRTGNYPLPNPNNGAPDGDARNLSVPPSADSFEAGLEFYSRGDYAEAVRWYRMAADQGLAAAQYNLGFMYANGHGVPQNDAEAIRWYRMAAEQGYAKSQYNLGVMYAKGRGIPQNYVEAIDWYRLAADQGLSDAQNILGLFYSEGRGVPQNFVDAYKWYAVSAAQGNAIAVTNRDLVLDQMTPAQIAEGERLVAAWQPRRFLPKPAER